MDFACSFIGVPIHVLKGHKENTDCELKAVTISININGLRPDRLPFDINSMKILTISLLGLRFLGFLTLFLHNSKYLVVLLLLVILVLIVERFQINNALNEGQPAVTDFGNLEWMERELNHPAASFVADNAGPRAMKHRHPNRPKYRRQQELKDREYERKIEAILEQIRDSGKEDYQKGIHKINRLLSLRQQNLNDNTITKALR